MTFTNSVYYFFTGTGNSYRVATWLNDASQRNGISSAVIAIQDAKPEEDFKPGESTVIGLITPTHGFTSPWAVSRFTAGLPQGRGTSAFVLACRAGTKFGNAYFPGLEGTAAYLLVTILKIKGYSVRGASGVDMPSNWTSIHPGYGPVNAQAIIDHTSPTVTHFIETILNGGTCWRGIIPLLLGLLLLPISFGYLLVGRFLLGKLWFASPACNSCGLCARDCPVHAIRMVGKTKPTPYWTYQCESCMRCMNYCPTKSIETSYLWAVVLIWLTSLPLVPLLLAWLTRSVPGLAFLNQAFPLLVLEYGMTLAVIFTAYPLLWLLNQVPVFRKLFTAATPTHYYQRYHAPGVNARELQKGEQVQANAAK